MPTSISPKFKITANNASQVRAGNWDGGTTKTFTQNTMGSNQTLHFAPGIWTPGDTLSLKYYQTKPGAGIYWGWQSTGQAMAWPLQNPDTDWQSVGHGWRYFKDRSGTGYAGNYKTGDAVLSLPASNEYLSAVTTSLFFRALYVAHPSGSSQATKTFASTLLPHDDTVALGDDKPFYIKCMVIQMLDPISGDYIKNTRMSVGSQGNITNTVPRYDAKTLRYAGDPSGDRRQSNWAINQKSYRHLPFHLMVVVANPNYKAKTYIYPAHGSKTYTIASGSAQGARDTSPVMTVIDPEIPARMNSFFTTGQSLETRNPSGWSGSPVWEIGDTPEFRMRFPNPWRVRDTVGDFSTTGPFARLAAVERPTPTLVIRGVDQTPNSEVTTNNISVFEGISKSSVLAFNNNNYLIEQALDFDGVDLTAQVANNFNAVVDSIDFNVPGQHTVTWTATDSYGLSTTIRQTLEVFGKPRQRAVPSGEPISCEDLNMNQNRWLELDEPWLAVSRFQRQTLSYNQARNFYARSTFIPGDTYDRWYGTGSLHFPGFTRSANIDNGAISNTVNVKLSDFVDRYNITVLTRVKPESKNTYYTSGDAGIRMQVIGPEDVTVDITINDDKRSNVATDVAEWTNLGLTTDELRATGVAGKKPGKTNYPVKIELTDGYGTVTTLDHIWIQLGQAEEEFTSLYARHTWWPVKLTPEPVTGNSTAARKQGAYIQPSNGAWTHDPSTDPSCDSDEYMIWGYDKFKNSVDNTNYYWLMHGFLQNYGIWSPLGCYHPTERKFLPEPKHGYQQSMPVEKGDGDTIDENADMFVYTDHAALKPDTKYNIMFAGIDHSGFMNYDNLRTRIELYAPDQSGGYESEPFEVIYPSLNILDDDFDTRGGDLSDMQMNWYFDGLQVRTYPMDEEPYWAQPSRNFNKDGFYQVNHERTGVVGDPSEDNATRTRSAQHYNYDGTEVNENSLWSIGGTFGRQDGGWDDSSTQTTFTTPPARIRKEEQYMAYKVVIKARGLRDISKDPYSNTYKQQPGATYANVLPKAIGAVIYQKDKTDPLAFPHGHRIEELEDGKKLARSIYFGHARNGVENLEGTYQGQYRDLQHVLGPNIAWTTRDHCYATTELQRLDKNRYRPDQGDKASPAKTRSGVIPSTNGAEFEWDDAASTTRKTTTAKNAWSWPIIDVVFGDIVNLQIDTEGNIINDGTIYTGD